MSNSLVNSRMKEVQINQALKNSTVLQLYARADAPCRDYYGLTVAEKFVRNNLHSNYFQHFLQTEFMAHHCTTQSGQCKSSVLLIFPFTIENFAERQQRNLLIQNNDCGKKCSDTIPRFIKRVTQHIPQNKNSTDYHSLQLGNLLYYIYI